MARKRTSDEPPREPELRVSHNEAAQKLDERIVKGRALLAREIRHVPEIDQLDDDYDKWNAYNRDLLGSLVTTPKLMHEYSSSGAAGVLVMSLGGGESASERLERIRSYIAGKTSALESAKERLELIPIATGVPTTGMVTRTPRVHTNRAFIVHGHDEAARESIARFLARVGVEPIILHEQATEGRTIIEKLEHYSDVDFAVILLTPDDIGAAKTESDKLRSRARQNVLLELGFFAGKLGRKHVCALYLGPLELPSDYLGVGYVELDSAGGWQLKLAKELRAAGFSIDMNAI